MDKNELEKLESIKLYTETSDGKVLRDTAKDSIINAVYSIANSYDSKTHIELIQMCAKLSSNLSMYQLLTKIEDQIEAIKSLYEEQGTTEH